MDGWIVSIIGTSDHTVPSVEEVKEKKSIEKLNLGLDIYLKVGVALSLSSSRRLLLLTLLLTSVQFFPTKLSSSCTLPHSPSFRIFYLNFSHPDSTPRILSYIANLP